MSWVNKGSRQIYRDCAEVDIELTPRKLVHLDLWKAAGIPKQQKCANKGFLASNEPYLSVHLINSGTALFMQLVVAEPAFPAGF